MSAVQGSSNSLSKGSIAAVSLVFLTGITVIALGQLALIAVTPAVLYGSGILLIAAAIIAAVKLNNRGETPQVSPDHTPPGTPVPSLNNRGKTPQSGKEDEICRERALLAKEMEPPIEGKEEEWARKIKAWQTKIDNAVAQNHKEIIPIISSSSLTLYAFNAAVKSDRYEWAKELMAQGFDKCDWNEIFCELCDSGNIRYAHLILARKGLTFDNVELDRIYQLVSSHMTPIAKLCDTISQDKASATKRLILDYADFSILEFISKPSKQAFEWACKNRQFKWAEQLIKLATKKESSQWITYAQGLAEPVRGQFLRLINESADLSIYDRLVLKEGSLDCLAFSLASQRQDIYVFVRERVKTEVIDPNNPEWMSLFRNLINTDKRKFALLILDIPNINSELLVNAFSMAFRQGDHDLAHKILKKCTTANLRPAVDELLSGDISKKPVNERDAINKSWGEVIAILFFDLNRKELAEHVFKTKARELLEVPSLNMFATSIRHPL